MLTGIVNSAVCAENAIVHVLKGDLFHLGKKKCFTTLIQLLCGEKKRKRYFLLDRKSLILYDPVSFAFSKLYDVSKLILMPHLPETKYTNAVY
jgi:hypothetical protein